MTRLALLGLVLGALTACGIRESEFVDYRLFAMATAVDLKLPLAAQGRHPELIAAIEADLREFEIDYYAWADGELGRLNHELSATGGFAASADMAGLLRRSQQVATATGGAFDPGVGTLVELWGFNDGSEPPLRPPTDAAIATALAVSGSVLDLKFDGNRLSGRTAEYTLDLGGIAKGAAVDRIAEQLGALGVTPALINAGGDLRVVGAPTDREWRIGIQAPRGRGLLGSVLLNAGEAAFSSGDYERYFESDGERLHHILDPRTGRPAMHTRAVTVIADDGSTADAAATGLFVAGPAEWQAMASRLGIELALRVDADGSIEMTPAMRDRFQTVEQGPSDIIVAGD
jgi:thiamine biosynthesis lipoprotein